MLHSSFTLHFSSSTEQFQWHFCGMRPYSFLSPFEAVLGCTGMNCCNAKWDVFPLYSQWDIYPDSTSIWQEAVYQFQLSWACPILQHCTARCYSLDTTCRTAETENILRNPHIWYLGNIQAKYTLLAAGAESTILSGPFQIVTWTVTNPAIISKSSCHASSHSYFHSYYVYRRYIKTNYLDPYIIDIQGLNST